jgi:hypothetical protein
MALVLFGYGSACRPAGIVWGSSGTAIHPVRMRRRRIPVPPLIALSTTYASPTQQTEEKLMTDFPQTRGASPGDYTASGAGEKTGWTGWDALGGMMMILLGFFQAIEGLVALFDPGYYLVSANGLVVNVNYNTWGWVHLILGVAAIAAGFGLIAGNTAARVLGVILAGLSAILNLAFIAAYPIWSTVVIAVDIIVIYAIIVHGRELKA